MEGPSLAGGARMIAESGRQAVVLRAAGNLHPWGETLRWAQGDTQGDFVIAVS